MPEPDYVRAWDPDLKRTYTAVRSSVDPDNVLEGVDALDDYGNPAAPEFDLTRKPVSDTSGKAADKKETPHA